MKFEDLPYYSYLQCSYKQEHCKFIYDLFHVVKEAGEPWLSRFTNIYIECGPIMNKSKTVILGWQNAMVYEARMHDFCNEFHKYLLKLIVDTSLHTIITSYNGRNFLKNLIGDKSEN